MTNYFELIKGLSPEEQENVLNQVKTILKEQSELEKQDQLGVYESFKTMTDDDLISELKITDLKEDRARRQGIQAELRARQKAAAAERNTTSMPAADYQALQARRAELVSEMDLLGKNPSQFGGVKRIREIKQELASMPAEPDKVIKPEPEKKTDE